MLSLLITSLVVAFGVSFTCSLMEACLLSLTPGQLADLSQRHPRIGAIWQEFKGAIEKPIAAILTLNTLSHTIGATVAGAQFAVLYGDLSLGIFSAVFSYVMLQFTEILPKSLGVRYNTGLTHVLAHPLRLMTWTLTPVVIFLHWVNRPFEGRRLKGMEKTEIAEIEALAGVARESNEIGMHQERIIRKATRLADMKAADAAIPVDQVTFLSSGDALEDAIVRAHLDPHTRFPVIEGDNRDAVMGYINFKELVYRARTNPADPTLRGIIRPVHFVKGDMTCDEVLKLFTEEHAHMAIVQDKDGKTLGLLTLEDIVEELVGELEDEFDRLPRMFQALSKGVWIIGGGVPVADLRSRLALPLPPETVGTLSAWMLRQSGQHPQPGSAVRLGDKELTIRRLRRGKVFEVLVAPPGMLAPP